jgi:hypothetical protein
MSNKNVNINVTIETGSERLANIFANMSEDVQKIFDELLTHPDLAEYRQSDTTKEMKESSFQK